ncbi:MAG: glycosyltransferase family 2 protein [Candidatus Omnitrophota bacterium]|nr:glycosyltransferase family 2 protein [Candidatus Omnitrophota bacterium]
MNKICALIPAYNEARTIGRIVREIRALGLCAYVVDDGSGDGTAIIAEAEGAIVIKHEKNMGKGASLRDGYSCILKKDFDAVIIIDGDGQHEVKSAADFIKQMERDKSDIVIGNRMLDTGAMPYIRRKTNRFMSYLISKIIGQYIPDTQCGYRLIKREVLESVRFDSSNFEIDSELIIKAGRKGFRISSIPIKTVYEDEKSKINPIVDTLRFVAFIIKVGAGSGRKIGR